MSRVGSLSALNEFTALRCVKGGNPQDTFRAGREDVDGPPIGCVFLTCRPRGSPVNHVEDLSRARDMTD